MYARYNGNIKQELYDHIESVRKNAVQNDPGNPIVELAAILHDWGKARKEWQEYLFKPNGETKVNHTPHGIHMVEKLYENCNLQVEKVFKVRAREYIMYLIGAHHGLFDACLVDGKDNFHEKIEDAKAQNISECNRYLNRYFTLDFLQEKFNQAVIFSKEEALSNKFSILKSKPFADSIILRMNLSSLIDSDWKDASRFSAFKVKGPVGFENFDKWDELLSTLKTHLNSFDNTSEINKIRSLIGKECEESGRRETGIYKLNVPTGAGKTMSVMRFALNHAKLHNKKRILYIAPFISILEQNANEYRKVFGDKYKDIILEHHSNVSNENDSQFEITKYHDFYQEDWSAPIILTTMVRLLQVFFSNGKKDIRRMNKLKDSIIVIDEFQSIPSNAIALVNNALNALHKMYNVTVVLCTATQPPYEVPIEKEDTKKKIPELLYSKSPLLTKNYNNHEVFKRVEVIVENGLKPFNLVELSTLISKTHDKSKSTLVILNTRKAVNMVYDSLYNKYKDVLIALSNNMTPAHKLEHIEEIKRRCGKKEEVLCISTNLIEAGVDVSFKRVIRSLTGLDSLTQTAGRANRNKEWDQGFVHLLSIDDEVEKDNKMKELNRNKEASLISIESFKENPDGFENNLLSESMMNYYYLKTLMSKIEDTHYPVEIENIRTSIYKMLTSNVKNTLQNEKKGKRENPYFYQSFKTAAELFKVIAAEQKSIVVPYEKGKGLAEKLLKNPEEPDVEIWKKLQRHTVNVYPDTFNRFISDKDPFFISQKYGNLILENSNFYYIPEFEMFILKMHNYSEKTGLIVPPF